MSDTATQLASEEQLSAVEQQIMDAFEARAATPGSPDTPTPPSTTSPDVPTVASDPAVGAEGGDGQQQPSGDSGVATGQAAPVTPPPSIPPSTEPPSGTESQLAEGVQEPVTLDRVPAPAETQEIEWQAPVGYTQAGLDEAIRLHQFFGNLQPQQIVAIDGFLNGSYRLVPAQEAAPAPVTQPPGPAGPTGPAYPGTFTPTPPGQPQPVPQPQPTVLDAEDWVDPRAAEEINRLRTELSQVRESIHPLFAQQQQVRQQQEYAAMDTAVQAFLTAHELSPADQSVLVAEVARQQIINPLVHRHNGNLTAAMTDALEMVYWTMPQYRQRELDRVASGRVNEASAAQEQERQRQVRAAALAGGGGSAPRVEPIPSTPQERREAMAAEIAVAMSQPGGTS